ncbi:MAG: hypothetical protein IPK99_11920 [Flavobacteriales bacterium]|nr:hypothetical protein [Flavobacteriales bacterium]
MIRNATLLSCLLLLCGTIRAQAPTNDTCAYPQVLPVNGLLECPLLGVACDNSLATWDGDFPLCDGDGLNYFDLWYTFNSEDHSEVFIALQPGTITDWGVEVIDTCFGTSLVCGVWPLFEYTVPTVPNTDYLIRVFTNADFGSPGTYSLCLSAEDPPLICDGDVVKSDLGDTTATICKDGVPDPFTFVHYSQGIGSNILVLTDDGDNVIAEIPAGYIDADTLRDGAFRIHGISYDGSLLNFVGGISIRDVESDGLCLELSDTYFELFVDLCTGLHEGLATGWDLRSTADHLVITGPATGGQAELWVHDALGRPVLRQSVVTGPMGRCMIAWPDGLAHAAYVVRIRSHEGNSAVARVVR